MLITIHWMTIPGAPLAQVRDEFLLRVLGRTYYDRIGTAQKGKPFIRPVPGEPMPPYFNLTHTNGLVACALGGCPMGLDVEKKGRPMSPVIINRILSPKEKAVLQTLPEEEHSAYLLERWVAKESYLKLTGDGLTGHMEQLTYWENGYMTDLAGNVLAFIHLEYMSDYLAAVATEQPAEIRWA